MAPHKKEVVLTYRASVYLDTCETTEPSESSVFEEADSLAKILCRALWRLLLNPIVFMVFIGLAFHFIFHGYELYFIVAYMLS